MQGPPGVCLSQWSERCRNRNVEIDPDKDIYYINRIKNTLLGDGRVEMEFDCIIHVTSDSRVARVGCNNFTVENMKFAYSIPYEIRKSKAIMEEIMNCKLRTIYSGLVLTL